MGNLPARSDWLLMTQNTSVQHQRMILFPTGKMFQAPDLNLIVEFIFMFYKEKPIDWLLDHILWVKVCNPEKDAVCTLTSVLKSITVGYNGFSSFLVFTETLRAAEIQPAYTIQALPVSTRRTPFFSCWKDPKTHSECHSLTVFYSNSGAYFLCRNIGFRPVCVL